MRQLRGPMKKNLAIGLGILGIALLSFSARELRRRGGSDGAGARRQRVAGESRYDPAVRVASPGKGWSVSRLLARFR